MSANQVYWRFQKTGREFFVEFLRRVLKYGGPWSNTDLEIIDLDNRTSNFIFEQFFEENEIYPLVTVTTQGGQNVSMAFNSQVENVYDAVVQLGVRGDTLVQISSGSGFAIKVPTSVTGSIRGAMSYMTWVDPYVADIIAVNLYQDYFNPTGSVLLASGTIQPFTYKSPIDRFVDLYPVTRLFPGTDYWVEYRPQITNNPATTAGLTLAAALGLSAGVLSSSGQTDTRYQMVVDSGFDGQYASISFSGSVPTGSIQSGSVVGNIRYAPFMRIGGAFEFTVLVNCSSKNSMGAAQNLADLVTLYTELSKHAIFDRTLSNDMRLKLSRFIDGGVSYLTGKGITVKSVRQGPVANRRRDENDIIFTVPVTIELRTEWWQDFDETGLLDVEPTSFGAFNT